MEIDSPPEPSAPSHSDLILQRLSQLGIPWDLLNQGRRCIIDFARRNISLLGELVFAILPSEEEEVDKDAYCESLIWLQWLMFEDEPEKALTKLSKMSDNGRGVCGDFLGNGNIMYRCRTCELDSTCVICATCFKNGNHKGHDYSVKFGSGGCCDCGDITAWKREGFCSKHNGPELIKPLPEHITESAFLGPVLDLLLSCWKDRLVNFYDEAPIVVGHAARKSAEVMTSSVVVMLLDLCKHSEGLLSFISQRVYSSAGLLDVLLMAERFTSNSVFEKLHELLLKMLGKPEFKYEFAKAFILYYPTIVNAAINEGSDSALKKYPLISTFSVQVLNVPTLTPALVKENHLLDMLLQCLGRIFSYCAGDEGKLLVAKLVNLYETTLRVLEDIRCVMSHSPVPKYMCQRQDLLRAWMELLASVQGMNTQKRRIVVCIKKESKKIHVPFNVCHFIFKIISLQVAGAFSVNDYSSDKTYFRMYKHDHEDQDILTHAKVGMLSQESSVSTTTEKGAVDHEVKVPGCFPVPSSALRLLNECLRSLDSCLEPNNTLGPLSALSLKTSDGSSNFLTSENTLSRFGGGRYTSKPSALSGSDSGQPVGQLGNCGRDDNILVEDSTSRPEDLRVLSSLDWPDIRYHVSSQEISLHIPLHRLLSIFLLRALKEWYGESVSSHAANAGSVEQSFIRHGDFLSQILVGSQPYGFSGSVMEHPLRIRAFVAQVHAKMWIRNGDAPKLFSEWYRSVCWYEQAQELDLFLLQCCAALAQPDFCVQEILDCFMLSNYLSLNCGQPTEGQSILAAEMLTLLIQIVKERRFCGLTIAECLQRELVYKLSIEDATHSQLVNSLPIDLSKADELDEVLNRVAEYIGPSGMTQGMYKLRPSYWKDLDLYHPRWNSRDRKAAQERYLRFCNVSALSVQLPRWTNIYAPLKGITRLATCKTVFQIVRAALFYAVSSDKLPNLCPSEGVLVTALHLLALVLDVCQSERESNNCDIIPLLAFATEETYTNKYGYQSMFSLLIKMHQEKNAQNLMEAENFNLSSLVMDLIKKLVELEPACMTTLRKCQPLLADQFSQSTNDNARNMDLSDESEKHKSKVLSSLVAIMEDIKDQPKKFPQSCNFSGDDDNPEQEVCDSEVSNDAQALAQFICSLCLGPHKYENPVSYLVLLQKSRLLSFVESGPLSWDQANMSHDKHVLNDSTPSNDLSQGIIPDGSEVSLSQFKDLLQSALNDFVSIGRPQEVNAFMEHVKARFPSIEDIQLPCVSKDSRERTTFSFEALEKEMYSLIQSSLNGSHSQKVSKNCSSTGSSRKRSVTAESLLLGKYIAGLPKGPQENPLASQRGSSSDQMKLKSSTLRPKYDDFGPAGADGIYVSSCGHAVHNKCLDAYLLTLRNSAILASKRSSFYSFSMWYKDTVRTDFEEGCNADLDLGEFLCPVCQGLANSVLPALPGDTRRMLQPPAVSTSNFSGGSSPLNFSDMDNSLRLLDALSLLQRAANIAGDQECLKAVPTQNITIEPPLQPIISLLCGMYFPGQDKILDSTGRISYPLILWDTLKYSLCSAEIAARSRNNSFTPNYSIGSLYKELYSSGGFILSLLLDVTQSTKTTNPQAVLIRFQGIRLFAESLLLDTYLNGSYSIHHEGMLHILENPELEVEYPDIQLWRQARDPIIAHDAFTSFMWILFCLPGPMLSCKESYLSLVHVFYAVSVTQAILTCSNTRESIETEVEVPDNLFAIILKMVGKHGEAMQFFMSNCSISSDSINDSIRLFTFPYLRRCALLWKLINCYNIIPVNGKAHTWDVSTCTVDDMKYISNKMEELLEVEKLEKMFNIPPLDVIVNDEVLQSTALMWVGHFCKVFKAYKSSHGLRSNPAVPFKLMILPHDYEDLLLRYFKKCCPKCGAVKEQPALCLLCGEICSPNLETCCRESTCHTHAWACGAGIGVFLLIRRTTILLQRAAREAPWPSLYLDAFGEEDVDLRRGGPLFLSEERYATLTHMVASHGLLI